MDITGVECLSRSNFHCNRHDHNSDGRSNDRGRRLGRIDSDHRHMDHVLFGPVQMVLYDRVRRTIFRTPHDIGSGTISRINGVRSTGTFVHGRLFKVGTEIHVRVFIQRCVREFFDNPKPLDDLFARVSIRMSRSCTRFILDAVILLFFDFSGRSNLEYYNDPKSYPLSCWIPFTLNEDWMFISVYICHSIALLIVVFMYLGIDSYMFGAIYSIGGQLELLNSSINNIKNTLSTGEQNNKLVKNM